MKVQSNNMRNQQEGLRNMFRSLRYRNYRLFFIGQIISLVGTWIQSLALPWLVYRLTDSAVMLGVISFASQIPSFLLSPFAGVFTDRYNRYKILILTQVLAMLQAFALTYLYFSGTTSISMLVILGFFLGCVNALDMPVRQAFLFEMIDSKEDLPNAIALNSSMVNVARLLGPSIAGIIIAATNEGICFLLNGISFFFVLISLFMMKIKPREIKPAVSDVFHQLKEGFSYAFGFPPIRYIILLLALMSLMGMPYAVLMPVIAKEVLKGDSHEFGFLMGITGVGALVGAMYLASRKSVVGLVRIIPISVTIFSLGLILFSFSRSFELSLILMMVIGFGMLIQIASTNTILQTLVDDDMRGRVMSFYTMAFMGVAPFGSLFAGKIAETIGAPYTLLSGGVGCLIGAIFFATKLPDLRKLIRPVYIKLGIIHEVAAGLQTATETLVPPEE